MDIFFQQIINGLVIGSVYALVALGYTMVYGILGIINFAHGEVVMIGAMIALSIILFLFKFDIPIYLSLALVFFGAITFCSLLAFCIEKVAYKPLRNAPRLAPLITAIGVSILLQNIAMLIWGRQYYSFPQIFNNDTYQIFGIANITTIQIIIILISLVTMFFLFYFINKTQYGMAMRATSEDKNAAKLMGIEINNVISITFIVGASLAAVAGILIAANYGIAHYSMGFMLGLKAFTAAVLGGIGNIVGAVIGGLLLGLIESLGAGYIEKLTFGFMGSNYQDVIAFLVLVLVLVIKPNGLVGEKSSTKV